MITFHEVIILFYCSYYQNRKECGRNIFNVPMSLNWCTASEALYVLSVRSKLLQWH